MRPDICVQLRAVRRIEAVVVVAPARGVDVGGDVRAGRPEEIRERRDVQHPVLVHDARHLEARAVRDALHLAAGQRARADEDSRGVRTVADQVRAQRADARRFAGLVPAGHVVDAEDAALEVVQDRAQVARVEAGVGRGEDLSAAGEAMVVPDGPHVQKAGADRDVGMQARGGVGLDPAHVAASGQVVDERGRHADAQHGAPVGLRNHRAAPAFHEVREQRHVRDHERHDGHVHRRRARGLPAHGGLHLVLRRELVGGREAGIVRQALQRLLARLHDERVDGHEAEHARPARRRAGADLLRDREFGDDDVRNGASRGWRLQFGKGLRERPPPGFEDDRAVRQTHLAFARRRPARNRVPCGRGTFLAALAHDVHDDRPQQHEAAKERQAGEEDVPSRRHRIVTGPRRPAGSGGVPFFGGAIVQVLRSFSGRPES